MDASNSIPTVHIVKGLDASPNVPNESNKAFLRLAAAKSILRLATRWDSHISPKIFHVAIMMARDPSSHVRKSFLSKVHKMLKEHAIPTRYACAFVLASSDCHGDVRIDSLRYFTVFLKEHWREAWIHQNTSVHDKDGGKMTNCPEFIVAFLIHVLAHDQGFPSETCQDEDVYAEFCSPLIFVLRALVNSEVVDTETNHISDSQSYMLGLFRAIKKAEDAVDSQMTPNLHILSTIGFYILKALAPHCKSSVDSPHLILLPSSFYKVPHGIGGQEEYRHKYDFINESFVRRILDLATSYIAQPACPDSTQCRNFHEDAGRSNATRDNLNDILLRKKADNLLGKCKGEKGNRTSGKGLHKVKPHKVSSKAKEQKILSAVSSKSTELYHERSPVYSSTNVAPEIVDPNFRKEHCPNLGKMQLASSCDSASMEPSLPDSQFLSEEARHKGISLVASHGATTYSRSDTESVEVLKSSSESILSEKELCGRGEMLVDHRVRIWSPLDKCFTSGIVDSYDPQNSNCKILNDGGDVELMRLENENWEVIDERPTLKKDKSNFHPRDWSFSSSASHEDDVDAFGDDSCQDQSGAAVEKRHLPLVTEKKISKSDVVAESVTNVGPRTRARRV